MRSAMATAGPKLRGGLALRGSFQMYGEGQTERSMCERVQAVVCGLWGEGEEKM